MEEPKESVMDSLNREITGVVVTYNTEKIFREAYESVRDHLPEMKIIVIDGSDTENSCYKYVSSLSNDFTKVIQLRYNIGHGRGMCIGMYYVDTPYVILFDSDIVMMNNPLVDMKELMGEDSFGIGHIQLTGTDGHDFGKKSNLSKEICIPYLHPSFALVQLRIYRQFYPFVHHGAPCIFTMMDIHKKGLSDKILKSFDLRDYIQHNFSGTRSLIRKRCSLEIEGVWETNRGQI